MKNLPMVAIVGRPNVGKSSLFNRIIGQRQAIVAEEAGTTRDAVQGVAEWNGHTFMLVDTAGMQSPNDLLEIDVQAQIDETKSVADCLIMVVDAQVPLSQEDRRAAKAALKTNKPVILAVNKIDATANRLPSEIKQLGIKTIVGISAIHGTGRAKLLDTLLTHIPKKTSKPKAVPTIALLGRPNVGKSSIFNVLAGGKKALVSEQAGTTRDVNRLRVNFHQQTMEILDTAGIRKPGKAKSLEKFSVIRTTSVINEADVAVVVIDAIEPAVALDQKIAGLAKEAGKGVILAINKWDLVEDKKTVRKQLETRLRNDFAFIWWAPLVLTSANNNHNVHKLLGLAKEIIERRNTKLKTTELNKVLTKAVSSHPPAGLKNRQPKLQYITQTGTNPPSFSIFGTYVEYLHWSYKRYIEKQLRGSFDFFGTSVIINYKNK